MSDWPKLIPDFGLTAEQLDDKYNQDGDGQHPVFTHWDWLQVVAQRATKSGYWDWLRYKLQMAGEELDADNPYNLEAP